MNLAPYLDNERISTLLRAVRSGDAQWIEDASRVAREEPRLERVVDAILAANLPVGGAVPTAVATPPVEPPPDDAGKKGGEVPPPAGHPTDKAGRDR